MFSSIDTTNIVIAAFPFLALIAGLFYRLLGKRLPQTYLPALTQLATQAVHTIEMLQTNASSIQKKSEAMKLVETLFQDAHLPVPSEDMISSAIESAVLLLNAGRVSQSQGTTYAPTVTDPRAITLPQRPTTPQ